LGQPLYGKLEPTGYSNTGEGWANTAGLLGRINFASTLAEGRVAGVRMETPWLERKKTPDVANALLSTKPSRELEAAIETAFQNSQSVPATIVSLVIASPDFQRR